MNEEKQSIVDRLSKTVQDLTNQSTEFQNSVEICKYELNDTKEALRTKLQNSEALRIEMTEMSTRQHQSQNALERCSSQLEAMSSTVSELKRENYGLRQRVQTQKPTLPTTTASSIHRDCDDVSESGMNTIVPDDGGKPFEVYCDMETDFGGWTVIQRRQDGSVDFYRGWEDYKNGFGDLNGEFWLGNDKIHRLTNQGQRYELRVDLENFENESKFAKYDHFAIGDERSKYAITIGSYSGNAGDSLRDDNGMQFTTKDNDNDRGTSHNCAVSCTGAWWYNICSLSNLNGQYLHGKDSEWNVGIVWFHWLGMSYSLKRTEIKIRPVFKGESGFATMYERK
ncbi:fibrinogen-like protein A [Ptychodera flava]|uniref:fibrinogen-like protein A n=1 Tax=Ptychodera flava TaxID=63121 RepID=UPI003969CDC8